MASPISRRVHVETDSAGWTQVEYGPMRLRIHALKRGKPRPSVVDGAVDKARGYLDCVARHRSLLSRPMDPASLSPTADELIVRMVQNASLINDADLTPMATVAGAIADAVADWLFTSGMTRVIVDNGGDIAVRLAAGESVSVGARPDLRSPSVSHAIRLCGDSTTWGVTTSGFGGRSFTRGIASAVTVVGRFAAIADAAATAIANACFIRDKRILQMPAQQIDPNTDLKDIPVTVNIGPLVSDDYRRAILNACHKADDLASRGIITGALIAAGGMYAVTPDFERRVGLSDHHILQRIDRP